VIIATKAFDVEDAARSAAPLLAPGTVVQAIQNGLVRRAVAPIVGATGWRWAWSAASAPRFGRRATCTTTAWRWCASAVSPDCRASGSRLGGDLGVAGFKVALFDDLRRMCGRS